MIILIGAIGLGLRSSSPRLADVIAHPQVFEHQGLQLEGIARVPGDFYLFNDVESAAALDLSKCLLIRQSKKQGVVYRALDRQWVRVTGVMSATPKQGWDSGAGLLLEKVSIIPNRSPPRIKDSTLFLIFRNQTEQRVEIEIITPSEDQRFEIKPHMIDETITLEEGHDLLVKAWRSRRGPRRDVMICRIPFAQLPDDYEYSPAWSHKRKVYLEIRDDRIQLVPTAEAESWSRGNETGQKGVRGSQKGVRAK